MITNTKLSGKFGWSDLVTITDFISEKKLQNIDRTNIDDRIRLLTEYKVLKMSSITVKNCYALQNFGFI